MHSRGKLLEIIVFKYILHRSGVVLYNNTISFNFFGSNKLEFQKKNTLKLFIQSKKQIIIAK